MGGASKKPQLSSSTNFSNCPSHVGFSQPLRPLFTISKRSTKQILLLQNSLSPFRNVFPTYIPKKS
jgi:hypothetical protein